MMKDKSMAKVHIQSVFVSIHRSTQSIEEFLS